LTVGGWLALARHFNNPGDLMYKATFTDGSTAIVQSVFP